MTGGYVKLYRQLLDNPIVCKDGHMSIKSFFLDRNGDTQYRHWIYTCNRCACEIDEQEPHYFDGDIAHYCIRCAFALGKITEKEFLSSYGLLCGFRALVVDDEIEIWTGENPVPPSQRKNNDQRHTQTYSDWRDAVFERDDYTCQICGVRGKTLNAHHKKPFKDYPKLRHDIDNGITLCAGCHRKLHRGEIKI